LPESSYPLSILILSEDGDKHRAHIWSCLLKRTFVDVLDSDTQTHRIEFLPDQPGWRPILSSNLWKGSGRDSRHGRITLARAIARHLTARPDAHFVDHHVDGDRPWAGRETAENPERYRTDMFQTVRRAIKDLGQSDAAADRLCKHLFLIVPYYSIEAWLYQNLDELDRIADELPNSQARRKEVTCWRADRGRLDELARPKEHLQWLRDSYNRRLAEKAWPAEEVHRVGKSYHAAVEEMRQSADLMEALRRTGSPPFEG
jgi:hypothetical protein